MHISHSLRSISGSRGLLTSLKPLLAVLGRDRAGTKLASLGATLFTVAFEERQIIHAGMAVCNRSEYYPARGADGPRLVSATAQATVAELADGHCFGPGFCSGRPDGRGVG